MNKRKRVAQQKHRLKRQKRDQKKTLSTAAAVRR